MPWLWQDHQFFTDHPENPKGENDKFKDWPNSDSLSKMLLAGSQQTVAKNSYIKIAPTLH